MNNFKIGIQVFDAVYVRNCESAIICSCKTHFMRVAFLMNN
jgi:hypothetical protein